MRIWWDLNFHQLTVKICLSKAQKIQTVSCLLTNVFALWQNCRSNKVQILRWANERGSIASWLSGYRLTTLACLQYMHPGQSPLLSLWCVASNPSWIYHRNLFCLSFCILFIFFFPVSDSFIWVGSRGPEWCGATGSGPLTSHCRLRRLHRLNLHSPLT